MTTVHPAVVAMPVSSTGPSTSTSSTPQRLLLVAAIATTLLIGLQSYRGGNSVIVTLALVGGLVVALPAAVIDARILRLPNRYVAGVALSALVAAVSVDRVAAVSVAALLGASPYLLLHLARPTSLGFGDVKFAATLGGLVGALSAGAVTVMLAAAFTLAAVIRWRRPQGAVALGPTIMAGALIALAVAVSFQAAGLIS